MTDYRGQLETAINAVRFRSASEALWFGRPVSRELPRRVKAVLTPDQARACVLTGLQDRLYRSFYCQAAALPSFDREDQPASRARATDFVERLSEANAGLGYLDPGWEVRRLEPTYLEVGRNGFVMRVRVSDCELPAGAVLTPGLAVSVRLPKELLGRAPGFYIAKSNAWFFDGDWSSVVRLYWNVAGEGGLDLMESVTRLLNEAGTPFQLKVMAEASGVSRADAAVLYLHKRDYAGARHLLERVQRAVAPSLRPAIPALTKALAPGVGLAEDPGNGLSFGEHRCRLIADGLVRANGLGKISLSDRLRVVLERFAEERIDLDRPYLNPGSEDAYPFGPGDDGPMGMSRSGPALTSRNVTRPPDRGALPWSGGDAETYVMTAARIGRQICQEAKWSGGRCNWMGATVDGAGRTGCGALDASLYEGASGIAWFLAELSAATDDGVARATALGAIEQAFHKADGIAPGHRVGLYTGWIGVALAAARVGIVLAERSLLERAADLLRRLEPAYGDVAQWDVISGAAGGITGLVVLAELLEDPSLVDAAARLGDATLGAAMKGARHWSWRTINSPREVNLTGFSHGAAGIACALWELHRITGDARYGEGAARAFEYERGWFAAGEGNWPDLRGYPARGLRRTDTLPCGTVWCHGAPGIALSRLRAYQITGDDRAKAEALVALATTGTLTEAALRTMNFSLCHGLAGNGEVLHLGAQGLGADFPDGARLAADVAATGIERYGDGRRPWPCGAAGPTPALMIGLAGTGLFYLRLADPARPSVLLLDSKAAGATAVAASAPAAFGA